MFKDFNEEEIELYEKIGQKIKIRKEIEELNEKIEVMRVKEDIEGINLDDKIKSLSDRRDLLSEEEKEVGDSEEFAIIIGKLDEIKNLKKKLLKLEEKKGTIAENIYSKLQEEYENEFKKNELILLKETERIKKLNEEVDAYLKNINFIREEEEVRFNLNEYTKEKYNEKKEEIDNNEKKAQAILYATDVLLEEFTNELK